MPARRKREIEPYSLYVADPSMFWKLQGLDVRQESREDPLRRAKCFDSLFAPRPLVWPVR